MRSTANLSSFFSLIFSASRFPPRVFRPAVAVTQFFTFPFLMRFINYR